MYIYTDDELLDNLKTLASKVGHSPTAQDLKDSSLGVSYMTYFNRFGSWNNAKKLVGLPQSKQRSTKKEMIADLKQLAKEIKHIPSEAECNACEYTRCAITYRKKFGSWKDALKAAGLLNRNYKGELIRLSKQLGHTPSCTECDQGAYTASSSAYIRKYGSWKKALSAAGLPYGYNELEMIASLKRLAEELGTIPTEVQCDQCEYTPSFRTYLRKFGSWEKVKELIV